MSKSQVTSRSLCEDDRTKLIEAANREFERVLDRIEATNPQAVRKLWDAASYVDQLFSSEISYYDAVNRIDCFLVHDVIELATQVDQ
jgi:hypothetical protein